MEIKNKKDYVGLQFIAMSLFIIYFLHWAYQTKNNETGLFYGKSVFNILIYISCVLFVFALYIILKIVLNYISCKNKVLFVLYSGFFVYSIHFLYRMYEKEIEVVAGYELYINSMRQNMPHFLFAFFMLIIISGLFFSLRGGGDSKSISISDFV